MRVAWRTSGSARRQPPETAEWSTSLAPHQRTGRLPSRGWTLSARGSQGRRTARSGWDAGLNFGNTGLAWRPGSAAGQRAEKPTPRGICSPTSYGLNSRSRPSCEISSSCAWRLTIGVSTMDSRICQPSTASPALPGIPRQSRGASLIGLGGGSSPSTALPHSILSASTGEIEAARLAGMMAAKKAQIASATAATPSAIGSQLTTP